jgi:hypothetical protein
VPAGQSTSNDRRIPAGRKATRLRILPFQPARCFDRSGEADLHSIQEPGDVATRQHH